MGSQNFMTKLVLLTVCLQGLFLFHMGSSEAAPSPSLAMRCGSAVQTVMSCLDFSSGKATVPTPSCCNGVESLKEKEPECLCFLIGQTHNGSEQIKSLGIQEAKLIQLPSACHLANANITNCPKLLGISPSSPAAAIFLHNNATSPAGPISSSSSSTATPDNSSAGLLFKHEHGLLGGVVAVFVTAFLCSPSIQNFKLLF